jgi:hypothetical protein
MVRFFRWWLSRGGLATAVGIVAVVAGSFAIVKDGFEILDKLEKRFPAVAEWLKPNPQPEHKPSVQATPTQPVVTVPPQAEPQAPRADIPTVVPNPESDRYSVPPIPEAVPLPRIRPGTKVAVPLPNRAPHGYYLQEFRSQGDGEPYKLWRRCVPKFDWPPPCDLAQDARYLHPMSYGYYLRRKKR